MASVSKGATEDEASRNIKEASKVHIEGMLKERLSIPEATAVDTSMTVQAASFPHTTRSGGRPEFL